MWQTVNDYTGFLQLLNWVSSLSFMYFWGLPWHACVCHAVTTGHHMTWCLVVWWVWWPYTGHIWYQIRIMEPFISNQATRPLGRLGHGDVFYYCCWGDWEESVSVTSFIDDFQLQHIDNFDTFIGLISKTSILTQTSITKACCWTMLDMWLEIPTISSVLPWWQVGNDEGSNQTKKEVWWSQW